MQMVYDRVWGPKFLPRVVCTQIGLHSVTIGGQVFPSEVQKLKWSGCEKAVFPLVQEMKKPTISLTIKSLLQNDQSFHPSIEMICLGSIQASNDQAASFLVKYRDEHKTHNILHLKNYSQLVIIVYWKETGPHPTHKFSCYTFPSWRICKLIV